MKIWVLSITENDILKHTWLIRAETWEDAKRRFLKIVEDNPEEGFLLDNQEIMGHQLELEYHVYQVH